jgi:hypothetical protein
MDSKPVQTSAIPHTDKVSILSLASKEQDIYIYKKIHTGSVLISNLRHLAHIEVQHSTPKLPGHFSTAVSSFIYLQVIQ